MHLWLCCHYYRYIHLPLTKMWEGTDNMFFLSTLTFAEGRSSVLSLAGGSCLPCGSLRMTPGSLSGWWGLTTCSASFLIGLLNISGSSAARSRSILLFL